MKAKWLQIAPPIMQMSRAFFYSVSSSNSVEYFLAPEIQQSNLFPFYWSVSFFQNSRVPTHRQAVYLSSMLVLKIGLSLSPCSKANQLMCFWVFNKSFLQLLSGFWYRSHCFYAYFRVFKLYQIWKTFIMIRVYYRMFKLCRI